MLIEASSESSSAQYRKGNGHFLLLSYSVEIDVFWETANVRLDISHLQDYIEM